MVSKFGRKLVEPGRQKLTVFSQLSHTSNANLRMIRVIFSFLGKYKFMRFLNSLKRKAEDDNVVILLIMIQICLLEKIVVDKSAGQKYHYLVIFNLG